MSDTSIQQDKELSRLKRQILDLFASDTTYLIPEDVDADEWYADTILGLVKARDEKISDLRFNDGIKAGRMLEHGEILSLVEAAHEYEQGGMGSGIQYFDNKRLERLEELSS